MARFAANDLFVGSTSDAVVVTVEPGGDSSSAKPEPTSSTPSSTATTPGPGSSTVAPTGVTPTRATTVGTTATTPADTTLAPPVAAPVAPTPPGGLAATGVDLGVPVTIALVLLLAGVALTWSTRRPRRQH
ncbi:MAG: hypothetical protein WKF57_12710 [Nakamurella sp.]